MSWNPDFWIKKEDFKELEEKLKDYSVWEFNIGYNEGYVLSAGEVTDSFYELHEIIENIPHWILNSEGTGCNNCIEWGKQIYTYKERRYNHEQ